MKAMIISYVESDTEPPNADTDYECKTPQDRDCQWLCLAPGHLIARVWVLSLDLLLLDLSSYERTDETLSFSH